MKKVLVLDFGDQYNLLVARRVRECGVYCEIKSFRMSMEEIRAFAPDALIFTGGPATVFESNAPMVDKALFEMGIPVLGITVMNSDDGRVVVYTVSDGYGAAEMGIRPDDVLLRADGQALGSIDDLMAVRRTHLVGDTITLTVLRDGQTFDVDVPLYASTD